MARLSGKLGSVTVGSAVAGIKQWSIVYAYQTLQSTALDSGGHHQSTFNLDGWKGTFSGYKDGAPLTLGSQITLTLKESTNAGQVYTGAAFISGLKGSLIVNGLVEYGYEFVGTGVLTRTGSSIDVGSAAIDRSSLGSGDDTWIDLNNPANASGTLTTITAFKPNGPGEPDTVKFGTFYLIGGNIYKCRAATSSLTGWAGAGLKTWAVSLDTIIGDVLGVYMETGLTAIDLDLTGIGCRYVAGNYVSVGAQADFSNLVTSAAISLYSTGYTND